MPSERGTTMEFIEQLTDLDPVEVSVHGPRESYFEPTAAICFCIFKSDDESDSDAGR